MKKTIKFFAIAVLASITLASCKKNLDLFPANSIELSQSFQTVQDAKAYDNGIYALLRSRQYGNYTVPQDVQADQLNATIDYGNRNGSTHKWGTNFLADDQTISAIWQGYYFALKNVNAAINGYPAIPTTTVAEKTELDRYLGNALMARAYYYSELIIRWAKPYEPATAATDLGVPLVLTYDPLAKPARATVKVVYDQIIKDITQAKPLLASVAGVKGSNYFTTHSVLALEARVKLNMQDWAGARTAAEQVINSGVYPLYTTTAGLNSMWTNDATQEVIQQSFVSKPNELANTNAIYIGFNGGANRFSPDFVPSQWVVDMYDNADLRKNVYFSVKTVYFQAMNVPNITIVNKFPGNPALFTGTFTNYQHAPRLFRVAELYLIAAEAGQREGGAGEVAAVSRLTQLRTARGLTTAVTTGTVLRDAIRDERFRELAFEGFRLWDLKRWHLGFTRRAPQNLNILQVTPPDQFYALSKPADDDKFTWPIPVNDITVNPNLAGQQNPGW